MKKGILLTQLLLLTFVLFAQETDKEINDIKNVIQTAYVEGLQNEGDLKKIDSGIHSEFNLLGIEKGIGVWSLSIEDWKKSTLKQKKEGKFPREGDDKVTVNFLWVDVTGSAAVAKIEFFVGSEKKYVDYISLYKFDEGWKMVNKIFYKF
jgi:hypothetical protein